MRLIQKRSDSRGPAGSFLVMGVAAVLISRSPSRRNGSGLMPVTGIPLPLMSYGDPRIVHVPRSGHGDECPHEPLRELGRQTVFCSQARRRAQFETKLLTGQVDRKTGRAGSGMSAQRRVTTPPLKTAEAVTNLCVRTTLRKNANSQRTFPDRLPQRSRTGAGRGGTGWWAHSPDACR